MLRSKPIVVFALLFITTVEAQAELSCHDFLRGAQLEDADVLAQAALISQPLLASKWHSAAMVLDIPNVSIVPDLDRALLLRQIVRDCRALPDETVESIASVHLRNARSDQVAAEAKKRADEEAQAVYEQPFHDRERMVAELVRAAPPLPSPLVATVKGMEKISCAQYLRPDAKEGQVEHAFTVALQKLVDSDPVARTAHIRYGGMPQYMGAYSYCEDNLHSTLAGAFSDYLDNARSYAPIQRHKVERNMVDALRSKRSKTADEVREINAYDAAQRAGPTGSCKWVIVHEDVLGNEPDRDGTGIAMRYFRKMDWCHAHPDASEDALLSAGVVDDR